MTLLLMHFYDKSSAVIYIQIRRHLIFQDNFSDFQF